MHQGPPIARPLAHRMALPGLSKGNQKANTDKHQDMNAKTFFASTLREFAVTMKTAEKELMHRVLDTLEQMLCEVSGSAEFVRCFPSAGDLSTTAGGWQDTVRTVDVAQHNRPTQSAYFCLTSASALVDVTRSLLKHVDDPCGAEGPILNELSAVSRAAGQSAYLASVILAGPKARPAGTRACDQETHRHRLNERPSAPSSIGGRLKGRLMSLLDGRPVARCS